MVQMELHYVHVSAIPDNILKVRKVDRISR